MVFPWDTKWYLATSLPKSNCSDLNSVKEEIVYLRLEINQYYGNWERDQIWWKKDEEDNSYQLLSLVMKDERKREKLLQANNNKLNLQNRHSLLIMSVFMQYFSKILLRQMIVINYNCCGNSENHLN